MSDILIASHLADEEAEAIDPADLGETEFTFANAMKRMDWLANHHHRIAKITKDAAEMRAIKQAELKRIDEWESSEKEAPLNSVVHHEGWFYRFYTLNPPANGKTIKLPNGKLEERKSPPKWSYGDEKALAAWLAQRRADLVKTEIVTTVVKDALKQAVDANLIINGVPYIEIGDGELVPLDGVTVTIPEPTFTVRING